jgi:hypothetical protein
MEHRTHWKRFCNDCEPNIIKWRHNPSSIRADFHPNTYMSAQGISFGAEQSISGEVVFNTSMVGYPEVVLGPTITLTTNQT